MKVGRRIGVHYDVNADGQVDQDDVWYWFAYDERWRIVATFREDDGDPKEVFVYHTAGLGGYGGSSYIDAVILRDRDANTAWDAASDGVLEERIYYCQNWRHDVVALITEAGHQVQQMRYSAYGIPIGLPAGDTNSGGSVTTADGDILMAWFNSSTYDVRADINLDGIVDLDDRALQQARMGNSLGWGALSLDVDASGGGNRKGYAGYEGDFIRDGFWHIRHRVLDSELGRFTSDARSTSWSAGMAFQLIPSIVPFFYPWEKWNPLSPASPFFPLTPLYPLNPLSPAYPLIPTNPVWGVPTPTDPRLRDPSDPDRRPRDPSDPDRRPRDPSDPDRRPSSREPWEGRDPRVPVHDVPTDSPSGPISPLSPVGPHLPIGPIWVEDLWEEDLWVEDCPSFCSFYPEGFMQDACMQGCLIGHDPFALCRQICNKLWPDARVSTTNGRDPPASTHASAISGASTHFLDVSSLGSGFCGS